MKILIIGASGMLGSEFMSYPQTNHTLIPSTRDDIDITRLDQLEQKITSHAPQAIINCAAYTKVDQAEQESAIAHTINGTALQTLSRITHNLDIPLIHYSTDYVFDGKQKDGYAEHDTPTQKPLNVYGASKLDGERHIQSNTSKYYIIRTSWLFGHNGPNFIKTIQRLAQGENPIRIVNDEYGRPSYTYDVVQQTFHLLDNAYPFGIYHITNQGNQTSWYEYARFILEQTNPKQLKRLTPITSKEYNAPATRPHYSTLQNTKLPTLPTWQDAVMRYLATSPISHQ